MSYNRIDMTEDDFKPDNFLKFCQSEEFNRLANDWPQVEAMSLDRENDRGHFDPYYDQSLEITDEKERQSFLLLKMFTSKYRNLISLYPSIENYLEFVIQKIRIRSLATSTSSDTMYNILMIYQETVTKCSVDYAPADFAVLFIKNPPKFDSVDFYERSPPGIKEYKGVKLSFSKKIVSQVIKNFRIHEYGHLILPEFLGECIISILPNKRLLKEIKGWDVPTPYKLSESRNTKEEFLFDQNPAKKIEPPSLCSIRDLNIISYDTNDLDIRTFADLIFTWPKHFGN